MYCHTVAHECRQLYLELYSDSITVNIDVLRIHAPVQNSIAKCIKTASSI